MKVWLKAGVIIFYVLGYCFLRKRMRRDISQLSKENPNMVFTSIGHLINKEMLKKCHETMQKDKATGIDGITKEWSYVKKKYKLNTTNFLFLCNC